MTVQGPIFLAGVDRSGIGLVGELLEMHPNIAISRRTNFWSFYYNRFGDLSRPENLERCLAEMIRYTRIQRLWPEPERIRREFQEGEPTYPRLFALFEEHYMQRLGKSRWGDKSLSSEHYADIILNAYPSAKMIHVIRDPRDRYASQLSHRGVGKGELGAGVAMWLWSVRLAERHLHKYPGRYKVVRYETLVDDPEVFLLDLCDYVGEEYSPLMLTMKVEGRGKAGSGLTNGGTPRTIWTTSIGRFREILSEREVAFIQLYTGRKMSRYAYAREQIHLSWSARFLFYLVDCPVNLFRLLFWRPWAGIKHIISRQTPSDRRLTATS